MACGSEGNLWGSSCSNERCQGAAESGVVGTSQGQELPVCWELQWGHQGQGSCVSAAGGSLCPATERARMDLSWQIETSRASPVYVGLEAEA